MSAAMPTPDEIDRLRDLYEVARHVNGAAAADDPRRAVSSELSALMFALTERGVSLYRIAKIIGTTLNGVKFRLFRHGFIAGPPSLAGQEYKGHPTGRAS